MTNTEYLQSEISRLMKNLSTFSTVAMTEFASKLSSDSDVSSCKAFMGNTLNRSMNVDDFDDFGPIDLEKQPVNENSNDIFRISSSDDSKVDCVIDIPCEGKGKEAQQNVVQFDFSVRLPDHSEFLIKEE